MYYVVFILFLIMSFLHLLFMFYVVLMSEIFIFEIYLNLCVLVVDMNIYFLYDKISFMFMFLVYFISSMVVFYSSIYMSEDKKKMFFLYLVVLFVFFMHLMVISPNAFMILLGWDGLGFVSYFLVIYYENEMSSYAGMLTILINRFGDVGMVLSLLLMFNMGILNFNNLKLEMGVMMNLICLMFMLGALTKSAQMPFSSWLPAAMAAPTPVSALVHSSTLVTAGVYIIIRLSCYFNNSEFSLILMVLSILTMFMAGFGALFEYDLKKIIALSTLSQLGVMMMILSVGKSDLAFFHLMNHAMFKAMLFLCAGILIHSIGGWQDIRKLGLVWKISPNLSMVFMLGKLSLLGFPFLSGFYSKDLILEMMYLLNNSYIMLVMIILGTLFTVLYSLRLIYYLFFNMSLEYSVSFFEEKNMYYPIYFMGFWTVILGGLLNWLIMDFPNFIFLSLKVKVLNLILIFFGFILILNWLYAYKNFYMMHSNFFNYFLSEMWFLKFLSSESFMIFMKYSKMLSKNSEIWFEFSMGYSFKSEIENLSMNFNKILFNGLTYFCLIVFIYIFIMILF
uniref:NADH dehydrogenase subunit 5 n=1 Tax=Tropilaelaps mercedesae TaxID=418985 RepID=UPI0028D68FAD|nr:NADH dehydrogenase subunit 5 [Tropilaelaps mercedesae]WMV02018.1 NADH dehydrogenase subunit 5 [Tropilaelaps mercedesae]